MCGIAGKIDFGGTVDPALIERMCAVMTHRGPDSRGTFVKESVGLGVQRLAIIDVAGGNQPIFSEDGAIAVVLNGEIYNFPQLREELLRRGHRFSSHGDTEVLVHLYEEHGERMVDRLRGMFAFAIWDERERRLFCARDRVGKKPLFWARKGDRVWFASEIRALLQDSEVGRAVDPAALLAYLAFLYVPHPLSAFESIRKLPPACTLTIGADGDRIERYWSLDYSAKLAGVATEELEERLRDLIRESTRIRLMSEVPLGAFLSGGVDSAAVVAAMAEQTSEPVKTFSIGFRDPAYNELRYARLIAERFGTDHHELVVEPKALEILPRLARQYGEPFGDSSAIPSFYLAELASRHVTVALNGDGGDESFAGYHRYAGINLTPRLGRPEWRHAAALTRLVPLNRSTRTKANRFLRALSMTPPQRYAAWMSFFDPTERRALLTEEFAASVGAVVPEEHLTTPWLSSTAEDLVDSMLDTDVQTYLPDDLLVKMDIATMAYSVEARSPFLDHELMQFAASLPVECKLEARKGKRLLKSALRGLVPDEILDRPKMGFSIPLARWFREELAELPGEILLDRRSLDREYFRRDELELLIEEHGEGRMDNSGRLWALIQLELWHREVVEAPRTDPVPAISST